MFWTKFIFIMIVATICESASINPTTATDQEMIETENLNEARGKVTVKGSLALEMFEYLLYQYKKNYDIIQHKMSGMLGRATPDWNPSFDNNKVWEKREYPFDGLAIATGVSLVVVILAIVFQPLAGVTSRFTRRLSNAQGRFDREKILQLTETIFNSIENFQKKISSSQ